MCTLYLMLVGEKVVLVILEKVIILLNYHHQMFNLLNVILMKDVIDEVRLTKKILIFIITIF
jgi:hypothetical protein